MDAYLLSCAVVWLVVVACVTLWGKKSKNKVRSEDYSLMLLVAALFSVMWPMTIPLALAVLAVHYLGKWAVNWMNKDKDHY